MKVLVLSCRIHSIEFEVFQMPGEKELCRGTIDKIGLETAVVNYHVCGRKEGEVFIKPALGHNDAVEVILNIITNKLSGVAKSTDELIAVGHRVIHGGEKYFDSVLIDDEVRKEIARNTELAPLHNPYNLKGIEAIEKLLPGKPQVAVFDTSFHHSMPEETYRYAIPEMLYQKYRIRKYGFHGISHRYVAERSAVLLKKPQNKINIISMHLGQGASLCAIKNGISVDNSMGFTPVEGVMMASRSGNLGPGVILFLLRTGMSINEVDSCVNMESGILGISGISDEVKDVVEAMQKGDKRAKLAIDMFVYRLIGYFGAYYMNLKKIDAICFTGGIGENSDIIRKKICDELEFLGIKIDNSKNKKIIGIEGDISRKGSKIKILIIPRDEKILIARDVFRLINKKAAKNAKGIKC